MSVCKVCGKEYHGNEENFICIHCKAEKGNNDWLTVEGRGSVNLSGRQTRL